MLVSLVVYWMSWGIARDLSQYSERTLRVLRGKVEEVIHVSLSNSFDSQPSNVLGRFSFLGVVSGRLLHY